MLLARRRIAQCSAVRGAIYWHQATTGVVADSSTTGAANGLLLDRINRVQQKHHPLFGDTAGYLEIHRRSTAGLCQSAAATRRARSIASRSMTHPYSRRDTKAVGRNSYPCVAPRNAIATAATERASAVVPAKRSAPIVSPGEGNESATYKARASTPVGDPWSINPRSTSALPGFRCPWSWAISSSSDRSPCMTEVPPPQLFRLGRVILAVAMGPSSRRHWATMSAEVAVAAIDSAS